MTHEHDLRDRTKRFALRVTNLVDALPRKRSIDVVAAQVVRSGTSVGAQYREAYRAKSKPDFVSKLTGCIQELDESLYWFELLVESGSITLKKLQPLMIEANELIAIFTTIVRKVKSKP